MPSALWWGLEVGPRGGGFTRTRLWGLASAGGSYAVAAESDPPQPWPPAPWPLHTPSTYAGGASPARCLLHGHDATRVVDDALSKLPTSLTRRLTYYRAFIATDAVKLEGVFARSPCDGQKEAFAGMLWRAMCLREGDGDRDEPVTRSL